MLEFLQKIIESAGIAEARKSIETLPGMGIIALPNHFTERDLEKFMPERRRQRGIMNTHVVDAFADYVRDNWEDGAAIFVDETAMSATAVLNLGTPNQPGHADNLAVLTSRKTAAYNALLTHASGSARSQVQIAEFLEDWQHQIECLHGASGQHIDIGQAIAAVRAITIEGLKKLKSEEQSLSAAKTTFESITASSDEPIPTLIRFKCEPYVGFPTREFNIRLGILTTDKPALVLRIIKQEEHDEQMGKELAAKLLAAIGKSTPVLLGKYRPQ